MICETLGYCRQAFYKQGKDQLKRITKMEQIRSLVLEQRKHLPRCGGRKIHHLIKEQLQLAEIACGRDQLFDIMRSSGLLVAPRRQYVQTTNSRHWMRKYENLVGTWRPNYAEQLWVSDITYIRTEEGFCYLSLVTDAYSRKIMGYSIADNMEAGTVSKALKMAIEQRVHPEQELIHHSDRGFQYCSKEYVQLAQSHRLKISMTQNGDPYENALAERMNRTIKEEFCLDGMIKSKELAIEMVKQAIWLYNNRRPHSMLSLNTPEQEHKKIPGLNMKPGTL